MIMKLSVILAVASTATTQAENSQQLRRRAFGNSNLNNPGNPLSPLHPSNPNNPINPINPINPVVSSPSDPFGNNNSPSDPFGNSNRPSDPFNPSDPFGNSENPFDDNNSDPFGPPSPGVSPIFGDNSSTPSEDDPSQDSSTGSGNLFGDLFGGEDGPSFFGPDMLNNLFPEGTPGHVAINNGNIVITTPEGEVSLDVTSGVLTMADGTTVKLTDFDIQEDGTVVLQTPNGTLTFGEESEDSADSNSGNSLSPGGNPFENLEDLFGGNDGDGSLLFGEDMLGDIFPQGNPAHVSIKDGKILVITTPDGDVSLDVSTGILTLPDGTVVEVTAFAVDEEDGTAVVLKTSQGKTLTFEEAVVSDPKSGATSYLGSVAVALILAATVFIA